MTKQFGIERIYFILHVSGYILSLRKVRAGAQGRNVETGNKTEALAYLLACRAQLSLLQTHEHLPRVTLTHSVLGLQIDN